MRFREMRCSALPNDTRREANPTSTLPDRFPKHIRELLAVLCTPVCGIQAEESTDPALHFRLRASVERPVATHQGAAEPDDGQWQKHRPEKDRPSVRRRGCREQGFLDAMAALSQRTGQSMHGDRGLDVIEETGGDACSPRCSKREWPTPAREGHNCMRKCKNLQSAADPLGVPARINQFTVVA